MKYIHISQSNNMVDEIVSLPTKIDIQELYDENFLNECVLVDDTVEVERGMYYDAKTGSFESREMPFFEEKTPFSEYKKRIIELEKGKAELENALCDMDAANEEAHATYETALCDLDETLNGGTV